MIPRLIFGKPGMDRMITDFKVADITSRRNKADVIIGMNTTLQDVTGIGKPFLEKISAVFPIELGSVLSFSDRDRHVHMLVCHALGKGGWKNADKFVRYGMDYLDHLNRCERKSRKFSVVRIGTGRVGRRDGADSVAIFTAMVNAHLPATLFLYPDERVQIPSEQALDLPELVPVRYWTPQRGEQEIRVAA